MTAKQQEPSDESTQNLHRRLPEVTEADSQAPADAGTSRMPLRDDAIPTKIGRYKILDILGLGGMGAVYLAEQTEPIRRRVALKLIKLGMDTKQTLARFESERQALAMMNHPNVAKVLDAGATEQGRPYFVMEHVLGVPITEYCDRHRLNTNDRLELFMQVCQAIQHAHQKGIIHRDVKPSNILVAVQDGNPVPKVIDFGVAKAVQQRLTEKTLFTEIGQLIGTPEYMSPEQAEMTALDIDTRTDIYSLGVLLYEMLVGALPFDSESLREAGLAEIQRIIREDEPPKPSTRLSSLGERSGTIAQKRRADVGTLARQLRGDLDWITMKAMEKDRTRRYASAAEFAEDILRHLRHEPIKASPPSAAYRFRKFVRRNKGVCASVSLVFTLLVIGLAVSTSLYFETMRERDRARAAEAGFRAINAFLLDDMLAPADPETARGEAITVKEALDNAAQKVETAFADQPQLEANIRTVIGKIYRSLGIYSKAEPQLSTALDLLRGLRGDDHPDTLDAAFERAYLMWRQGSYPEAESLIRRVLHDRSRTLGPVDRDTLRTATLLAVILRELNKWDEAEAIYRNALELQRRELGPEHRDTLVSMSCLADLLAQRGNKVEAGKMFRDALDIQRRTLGAQHPVTITATYNLAVLLAGQGELAKAEPLARRALENARTVLGPNHPETLRYRMNLSSITQRRGQTAIAESRETLERLRSQVGDGHPQVLKSIGRLATLLFDHGDLAQAEELVRQGLQTARRNHGERHPETISWMVFLSEILCDRGKLAEAEEMVRQAYEVAHSTLEEGHPVRIGTMLSLATCLSADNNWAESAVLNRQAFAAARRVHGEQDRQTLMCAGNLAESLLYLGQFDEAEELARQSYEGIRKMEGNNAALALLELNTLALTLHRRGSPTEAKPMFERAFESYRKFHADNLGKLSEISLRYGDCLKDLGSFAEAESKLLRAFEFYNPSQRPRHRLTREAIDSLADLYEQWDKPDQAAVYRELLAAPAP